MITSLSQCPSCILVFFFNKCHLFQTLVPCSDCSLRDAASTAYAQVCAPYHTWTIKKAVGAGMYALPTREQLLLRLNENG